MTLDNFEREIYINPFTNYGFKRLFGEEVNKNLLQDFLSELLKKEEGKIVDLQYTTREQLGMAADSRKAVFDIFCTNEKGEQFIVEIQNTKQKYFKDRTQYYSTFPIQKQAIRGSGRNFESKSVYTIAILGFVFDEDKDNPDKYRYDVKLTDIDTNKIFYDKFMFIYLEMPKFNKPINELKNNFEKWMYVIKNLNKLQRLPAELHNKVFEQLFAAAEIAKLSADQYEHYNQSMMIYRDINNSVNTAREEGMIEGMKEGMKEGLEQARIEQWRIEIIQNSIKLGLDNLTISKIAEISVTNVENIRINIKT